METLIKAFKKTTIERDPIITYNTLIGQLDSNFRKIEEKLNRVEVINLASYNTIDRPDASKIPPGSMIYNLTTNLPNFSDGTNWRDAAGVIV